MGKYYMGDLYWNIFFACVGIFIILVIFAVVWLLIWYKKETDKIEKEKNSNFNQLKEVIKMVELTEKEKQFLKRIFKAADVILDDVRKSDDMVDFDQNDLFSLAEKLNIDYWS